MPLIRFFTSVEAEPSLTISAELGPETWLHKNATIFPSKSTPVPVSLVDPLPSLSSIVRLSPASAMGVLLLTISSFVQLEKSRVTAMRVMSGNDERFVV
ncbi:MAG: hypothetical protein IT250_09400 [Chitinophagaceae bacterium]|nr:hypothetical protein [Chitinophagaceae bacterium]